MTTEKEQLTNINPQDIEATEQEQEETASSFSDGSEVSLASDYQPHEKLRKRKNLRRKRCKYQNITNELRSKLIELVTKENQKIKPTAKKLGINYSTAKSILQIYRKEGRVDKKLLFRPSSDEVLNTVDSSDKAAPSAGEKITEQTKEQKVSKSSGEEECRYSLRRLTKVENKDTNKDDERPDHQDLEPKLTKRVRKESEEVPGVRSPLSFESEALTRNNSLEDSNIFQQYISQNQMITENSIKSPIPVYKTFQFPKETNQQFQRTTKAGVDYPVLQADSIKIPTVIYNTAPQSHCLNPLLLNLISSQNTSNQPINVMNFDLPRFQAYQQILLQNQKYLLFAANASPWMRNGYLNNTINPAPKFVANTNSNLVFNTKI